MVGEAVSEQQNYEGVTDAEFYQRPLGSESPLEWLEMSKGVFFW